MQTLAKPHCPLCHSEMAPYVKSNRVGLALFFAALLLAVFAFMASSVGAASLAGLCFVGSFPFVLFPRKGLRCGNCGATHAKA